MSGNRKSGFTLIELIIVIVVIAVLAAILVPTINTILSDARVSRIASSVNSLKDAVTKFNGDTARFPREDLDFIRRPDRTVVENWKGPYLDSYPENPFKNDAVSDWRLTPDAFAQSGIAIPGEEAFGWCWFMDELGATSVFDRIEDQLNEGDGKLGNGIDKGLIHSTGAKRNIFLIVAYPTDAAGDPL